MTRAGCGGELARDTSRLYAELYTTARHTCYTTTQFVFIPFVVIYTATRTRELALSMNHTSRTRRYASTAALQIGHSVHSRIVAHPSQRHLCPHGTRRCVRSSAMHTTQNPSSSLAGGVTGAMAGAAAAGPAAATLLARDGAGGTASTLLVPRLPSLLAGGGAGLAASRLAMLPLPRPPRPPRPDLLSLPPRCDVPG